MFLNLLYRALKRDDSVPRLRAFIKRILQVSYSHQFIISIILFIYDIMGCLVCMQVCLSSPPQLACGLLFLASELFKMRPELLIFPKESKQYVEDEDDDEEEHYDDVVEEEDAAAPGAIQPAADRPESEKASELEKSQPSTWVHRKNSQLKQNNRIGYDHMARNPTYARAEQSGGYWEMKLLTDHFHPSVNPISFFFLFKSNSSKLNNIHVIL